MTTQRTESIIVEVTPREMKTLRAQAERIDLPVSELLRLAIASCNVEAATDEVERLTDMFIAATDRTCAVIDDVLQSVDASNARIAAMEAQARQHRLLT